MIDMHTLVVFFSEIIGFDHPIICIFLCEKIVTYFFFAHGDVCRFSKEIATPLAVDCIVIRRVSKMPHKVMFYSDF